MLDLVCIICHEDFSETDEVYATQCGHIFHQNCISRWVNDSRTCPQCRKACTSINLYKLYLESAIESSNNASVSVHAGQPALELYEEVNLNLKRELEMTASSLDDCQVRIINLEEEQQRVQNDLKEEIKKRENSEKRVTDLEKDKLRLTELDQSLQTEYIRVQNDLKREFKERQKDKERIAELEKDNFNLKTMVRRLEVENGQVQNDLAQQNERKGTTEERMAELEKKLEKEIQTRKKSERQLAQIEMDQGHRRSNSNQREQEKVSSRPKLSYTGEKKGATAEAILFGIPQLPNENLKSIFRRLCCAIDFRPLNVIEMYRSGAHNKPDSPIILKFESPQERDAILTAMSDHRKKVNKQLCPKDLGINGNSAKIISIQEYLTAENRALLQKALHLKRNNKLFHVYTHFGFVYVKQSATGIGIKIENEEMLNAIISTRKNGLRVVSPSLDRSLPSRVAIKGFYSDEEDDFLDE